MLFPSRASNLLLGSTYLTFLHLTTTNQVRSNFGILFVCILNHIVILVLRIKCTFLCFQQTRWEFCLLLGKLWVHWPGSHLQWSGSQKWAVVPRGRSSDHIRPATVRLLLLLTCSVCRVEFAWWPECSVNCQMINVQCAKCVFCAVWTVWAVWKLFRSVQCRGWCVLCQFPQSWNRWRHFGFH